MPLNPIGKLPADVTVCVAVHEPTSSISSSPAPTITSISDRRDHLGEATSTIRKHSQHGLGYLLNPVDPDSTDRDWIRQGWEWVLACAYGLDVSEPEWFDRPAMMRLGVTKPAILRRFNRYNARRSRTDQIRPFNFIMGVRVNERPFGSHEHMALIAPFESNAGRWEYMTYIDYYDPDGEPLRITTSPDCADEYTPVVQTIRDVFHEYATHPEHKSNGAIGLLTRRHVQVDGLVSIGKEMNDLEGNLSGVLQSESERYNLYAHGAPNRVSMCFKVGDALGLSATQIAKHTSISTNTLTRARRTEHSMRNAHVDRLEAYVTHEARRALNSVGLSYLGSSTEIMGRYLTMIGGRTCAAPDCDETVTGRQIYHADTCAKRARRERNARKDQEQALKLNA